MPVNNFSVISGRSHRLLGITILSGIKVSFSWVVGFFRRGSIDVSSDHVLGLSLIDTFSVELNKFE